MKSLPVVLEDSAAVAVDKATPHTVADGLEALGFDVSPHLAQTRLVPYDQTAVLIAAIHSLQLDVSELKLRLTP